MNEDLVIERQSLFEKSINKYNLKFTSSEIECEYNAQEDQIKVIRGYAIAVYLIALGLIFFKNIYYFAYSIIESEGNKKIMIPCMVLSFIYLLCILFEIGLFIAKKIISLQGIICTSLGIIINLIQNYLIIKDLDSSIFGADPAIIIIILLTIPFCFLYNKSWIQGTIVFILMVLSVIIFIIILNINYVIKIICIISLILSDLILIICIRKYEFNKRWIYFLILTAKLQSEENMQLLYNFPDPIIICEKGKIIYSNIAYNYIGIPNQCSFDFFHSSSDPLEEDKASILPSEDIAKKIKEPNFSKTLFEYIIHSSEIEDPTQFVFENKICNEENIPFQIISFKQRTSTFERIIYYLKTKTYYDKYHESQSKEKYFTMFISSITHDFRSPLNIILGNLDVIAFKGNLDIDQIEYIKHMKTATSQMLLLVQDILDYSTMKSSKLSVSIDHFELDKEILEIVDLFRDKYTDKGLYLKFRQNEDVPKIIVSDSNRIKQILTNLITNAYKFTENGGVTITTFYLEKENSLSISVEDTGIGINEIDANKLFKPFTKLSDDRKLNPNGYFNLGIGLGLHICKQILEILGGGIKVESTINVGSKFTIWVKNQILKTIANNKFEEQKNESSDNLSESECVNTLKPKRRKVSIFNAKSSFSLIKNRLECNCPKILIADDDFSNRFVIVNYCKKVSIMYDEAKDGNEAVNKVLNYESKRDCCKNFKLIFLDFNMPKKNGDEVAIRVRKYVKEFQIPEIIIIGLSGNNLEEALFRSTSGSKLFDLIVEKPLVFEKFKTILYTFI